MCVRFVQCTVKKESCLFLNIVAVNHVNQIISGTREILMDSSGLSGIMKGVGGCVVGYEFTRFASTIVTASFFLVEKKVKFLVF